MNDKVFISVLSDEHPSPGTQVEISGKNCNSIGASIVPICFSVLPVIDHFISPQLSRDSGLFQASDSELHRASY
jgi:hypothetical protein